MKRNLGIIVVVFLFIWISVVLSPLCVAAGTDNQSQNASYGAEKCELLTKRCNEHYLLKLEADEHSAESNTCRVIQGYASEITNIVYSSEAQNALLYDKIDLLYEKGMAAGILSWIYYSNYDVKDLESIKNAYASRLSVINKAEDIYFFKNGEVEGCYTLLLQSIYTEKIYALRDENDSDTVKAIISAAPSTMGTTCKYDIIGGKGEDGENYRAFYDKLVRNVTEQRRRDSVSAEVREVFSALYPNEVFETSQQLSDFFNSLNTKSELRDMNTLMAQTVGGLLEDFRAEGEHQGRFIDKKQKAVTDAVSAANSSSEATVANISESFQEFELELLAAKSKDSIDRYAKELLEGSFDERVKGIFQITEAYTKDGGIFDTASRETLDGELFKAKMECRWFVIYIDTLVGIEQYIGSGSYISEKAEAQYSGTAEAIRQGRRGTDGDVSGNLSNDINKMKAFVVDAEALKFETENREILKKEKVSASDRDAAALAIDRAEALSHEARILLSDILVSLGEKYKAAVTDYIRSHVTADAIGKDRESAVKALEIKIAALKAKNGEGVLDLYGLRASADDIVLSSVIIKELFDVYAKEYISLGLGEFSDEAASVVNKAVEKITEGGEGRNNIRDEAALELYRLAALEKIYSEADMYREVGSVSAFLTLAKSEIKEYTDKAEISEYTEKKISELREIMRTYEVGRSEKAIEDRQGEIKGILGEYGYLSDEKRKEILASLDSLVSGAKSDIENAEDASDVCALLDDAQRRLEELLLLAESAEREACLAWAIAELNSSFGYKEDYSAENYARILELIRKYEAEIKKATTVEGYLAALARGEGEIALVEDLLQQALRLGRESLRAVYDALMAKRERYSAEGLAGIEEIYTHTLAELDSFKLISDSGSVTRLTQERTALMRGIPINKIYTADGLLSTESPEGYPDGYDISRGYIGAVWAEGGMPSDAELNISGVDSEGIASIIEKAARKKRVSLIDGTTVGRDILKLLKSCNISAAVDIDLGRDISHNGVYRVSLLMPDNIDISEIIGVVFLSDDGSVEYFGVTQGADMIEFETSHFSRYYILSRGPVELMPWIICLSVIILCELVLVLLLLMKRKKRTAEAVNAFIPTMILGVRYRPVGGAAIVGILGGVAVALAALIGYLAYCELRERSSARRLSPAKKQLLPVAAEGVDVECHVVSELDKESEASEDCTKEIDESGAPDRTMTEEFADELIPKPLESVSAEDAETLMSDQEAKMLQSSSYEDKEIYFGTKKAQINIDVISDTFRDGDVVTLNSLKDRGLVGRNVGHVKILARGVLDKRLTVVAQDFSAAAVKMILLMGGEAVYTHTSCDRASKRDTRR